MRIAVPNWKGRISPVFDVASVLILIDVNLGEIMNRRPVVMIEDSFLERAKRVVEWNVNALICGAISWHLEQTLVSAGIDVIAQCCGDVEQVVEAFLAGKLPQETFLMPGCRGHQRRFQSGRRISGKPGNRARRSRKQRERGKEILVMPRKDGKGPPKQGGGSVGRMGGPLAAGPGGQCVCLQCGHRAAHVAGQPCNQQKCPKCGATMSRG